MKMLSTARWVRPSGRNASIIMRAACTRRGACESTPPEPTRSPRSIRLTRLWPVSVWVMMSEMVRSLCERCCWKARRRASRAIACSITRSSRVWGMVVGRIILFLTRFRSSTSSTGKGTQRRMFSIPASAITFDTE